MFELSLPVVLYFSRGSRNTITTAFVLGLCQFLVVVSIVKGNKFAIFKLHLFDLFAVAGLSRC